jgi:hypothetical protein
MPVLIVGNENTFSQLESRLIAGRASAAKRAKVADAIRRANPNVDLEDLQPGMVLTVPDMAEVRIRGNLSVDATSRSAIDEVGSQLEAALESTRVRTGAETRRGRERRSAVLAAMDSSELARAAKSNKELSAAIDKTRLSVAKDEELDKERSRLTEQAFAEWTGDLDALRELLPD